MASDVPAAGKIRLEVEIRHEIEPDGEGECDTWLTVASAVPVGVGRGNLARTLDGVSPEWLEALADDIDADGLMVAAIKQALRDEFADAGEGSEDDNDN